MHEENFFRPLGNHLITTFFFHFRNAPEPELHGHIMHEQLQLNIFHLTSCAFLCGPFFKVVSKLH